VPGASADQPRFAVARAFERPTNEASVYGDEPSHSLSV
jgi:hypothetical protein